MSDGMSEEMRVNVVRVLMSEVRRLKDIIKRARGELHLYGGSYGTGDDAVEECNKVLDEVLDELTPPQEPPSGPTPSR